MEQLSVCLGLEVIYVYGTVNGVEADFTLSAPGVWIAVVPKSSNGKYEVSITAYNSLGTPTLYNTIIYRLDDLLTPKTNWTSEDYYNAEDLNRVEINTEFVASYLRELQYNIPNQIYVVDRDKLSIDFISSINRVESNIEALKDAFITPPGYQQKKTWAVGMGFDYRDANRLERNLQLLYEWAHLAKENLKYCGTFYCGEDGDIY